MKKSHLPSISFFLLQLILLFSCSGSDNSLVGDIPGNPGTENPTTPDQPTESQKEVYYPKEVWKVNENNDYQDQNSQFNVYRMKTTSNLAAFWEAGFGSDPSATADPKYRFSLDDLLTESEKMYVFYRDQLKFVEKGNSLTDKYCINFYIYYSDEGTCYGGGVDNKIGVMWLTPGRIQNKPYGAMAHELGHAFQYLVAADGAWAFSSSPAGSKGQTIFELTSQYMLWQFYPNWLQFESYHFDEFMLNTQKSFLHEDNRYCAPFVLEYWSEKHGIDFIGKLWREAKKGEDPVMAYKRITGIDQKAFNDEIFDASRKFITWDMDRIRDYCKDFANRHNSSFTSMSNGWYQVAEKRCPQNYGYNGIRLKVPASGTEITLDFKGVAGAPGFRAINVDKAGWRYGFLAEKSNGERVYGDMYSDSQGQAKFTVPENTAYLWLVVSGAPTEHWEHIWDEYSGNDEEWPYQIKLTGTTLHSSVEVH